MKETEKRMAETKRMFKDAVAPSLREAFELGIEYGHRSGMRGDTLLHTKRIWLTVWDECESSEVTP